MEERGKGKNGGQSMLPKRQSGEEQKEKKNKSGSSRQKSKKKNHGRGWYTGRHPTQKRWRQERVVRQGAHKGRAE